MVDDDPLAVATVQCLLEEQGYQVDTASSSEDAVKLVAAQPRHYALVILDYRLGGTEGSLTVKALLARSPELFILIYSGDSSREAVSSTWKAGAIGFFEKGGSADSLLEIVRRWTQKYEETTALLDPNRGNQNKELIGVPGMVGQSKALKDAAARVLRYQATTQNILITGETGTGKELIARALHGDSTKPYIAVNCAVFNGSSELLESELFGYERGAFTGADREKKGVLEAAQGGTVFLDEIHHLSLTAQAKLLRVFQEKHIRRVGGVKEIKVDFRLITASKPNLEALCERGDFLRDLYHRLNVLAIHLPPLRERAEDIEPLVSYFCRKYEQTTGRRIRFKIRTLRYLENDPWPGNVRELENMLFRLMTDCPGDEVGPELLDARFFTPRIASSQTSYKEVRARHDHEERELIRLVVESSKSKFQAAQKLGISPTTLHSIMKRFNLYKTDDMGRDLAGLSANDRNQQLN